ncbi:MAG: xanthine dehydrogenase family protein subunit M [Chloroflexota bacterium]
MKPAPFKYYSPATVNEAQALLAEHGYDAKVLAGGQSLIPTMNFRLAQPAVLVDLNRVSELFYIKPDSKNGGVLVGAMARESQVEHSGLVAERAPLVTETMPHIAHEQIRHRGTFGGCIAHADPAAELPAVAVALKARMKIRNQAGERWVPAEEFFISLFTTVLMPDDLLVEVAIPPRSPRTGWSFMEIARRHGDYALMGVAATVTLTKNKACEEARLVYVNGGDHPFNAQAAAGLLQGQPLTSEVIEAAADAAATKDVDPPQDIHASAEYRRHLVRVLTRRALAQAAERAVGQGG